MAAASQESSEDYESTHVHAVYDAIAPHFSATRHKPWPLVTRFLGSRPPGSVGLDVGCGNAKYLSVNPTVFMLGSDRSEALLKLGVQRISEINAATDESESKPVFSETSLVADSLALPHKRHAADFIISIAVIHHMSTRERRQQAIAALLECLGTRHDAHALVYVWALEQSSSRRGWDASDDQDTLVPWVMRTKGRENPDKTYLRYYHLYKEGELEEDVRAAGGQVVESGYEKDNWWAIFRHAVS